MANIITELQKFVFGEKKYQEGLIKQNRISILPTSFEGKSLLLKDSKRKKVYEVQLLEVIAEREYVLYCRSCMSAKCTHSIVSYYSSEVLRILNDIYENAKLWTPEPIRKRLSCRCTRICPLLQQSVVPAIAALMLSIGLMVPVFVDPTDHLWHTMNHFLGLGNTLTPMTKV